MTKRKLTAKRIYEEREEVKKKINYDISRGSLIEIDGASDLAELFGYCSKEIQQN